MSYERIRASQDLPPVPDEEIPPPIPPRSLPGSTTDHVPTLPGGFPNEYELTQVTTENEPRVTIHEPSDSSVYYDQYEPSVDPYYQAYHQTQTGPFEYPTRTKSNDDPQANNDPYGKGDYPKENRRGGYTKSNDYPQEISDYPSQGYGFYAQPYHNDYQDVSFQPMGHYPAPQTFSPRIGATLHRYTTRKTIQLTPQGNYVVQVPVPGKIAAIAPSNAPEFNYLKCILILW